MYCESMREKTRRNSLNQRFVKKNTFFNCKHATAEIYPDLSVIARASGMTLKAGKFFGLRKVF